MNSDYLLKNHNTYCECPNTESGKCVYCEARQYYAKITCSDSDSPAPEVFIEAYVNKKNFEEMIRLINQRQNEQESVMNSDDMNSDDLKNYNPFCSCPHTIRTEHKHCEARKYYAQMSCSDSPPSKSWMDCQISLEVSKDIRRAVKDMYGKRYEEAVVDIYDSLIKDMMKIKEDMDGHMAHLKMLKRDFKGLLND